MSGIVVIFLAFCLASFDHGAAEEESNKISSRIYGGKPVDIKEMPFMASLFYYGIYQCSGSIVDDFYILTAAHCVVGRDAADLTVRVGSSRHDSGGTVHQVAEVIIHPRYDRKHQENDAAILFLSKRIILGPTAKIIPLSDRPAKSGESVLVAGWGSVEGTKGASDILRATVITVTPRSLCKYLYKYVNGVGHTSWCAADLVGIKDTCGGDSGGPAIQRNKIVGITSWGKGCGAGPLLPGVYTDTVAIKDWIDETLAVNK